MVLRSEGYRGVDFGVNGVVGVVAVEMSSEREIALPGDGHESKSDSDLLPPGICGFLWGRSESVEGALRFMLVYASASTSKLHRSSTEWLVG